MRTLFPVEDDLQALSRNIYDKLNEKDPSNTYRDIDRVYDDIKNHNHELLDHLIDAEKNNIEQDVISLSDKLDINFRRDIAYSVMSQGYESTRHIVDSINSLEKFRGRMNFSEIKDIYEKSNFRTPKEKAIVDDLMYSFKDQDEKKELSKKIAELLAASSDEIIYQDMKKHNYDLLDKVTHIETNNSDNPVAHKLQAIYKRDIANEIGKHGFRPEKKLVSAIYSLEKIHGKRLSMKNIENMYKKKMYTSKDEMNLVEEIGKQLKAQEMAIINSPCR